MVVAPHDTRHRIDFVVLDESLATDVLQAGSLPDLPLAVSRRLDHAPVFAVIAFAKVDAAGKPPQRCDRQLFRLPSHQEEVRRLWSSVPAIPADWSADWSAEVRLRCLPSVVA